MTPCLYPVQSCALACTVALCWKKVCLLTLLDLVSTIVFSGFFSAWMAVLAFHALDSPGGAPVSLLLEWLLFEPLGASVANTELLVPILGAFRNLP